MHKNAWVSKGGHCLACARGSPPPPPPPPARTVFAACGTRLFFGSLGVVLTEPSSRSSMTMSFAGLRKYPLHPPLVEGADCVVRDLLAPRRVPGRQRAHGRSGTAAAGVTHHHVLALGFCGGRGDLLKPLRVPAPVLAGEPDPRLPPQHLRPSRRPPEPRGSRLPRPPVRDRQRVPRELAGQAAPAVRGNLPPNFPHFLLILPIPLTPLPVGLDCWLVSATLSSPTYDSFWAN